MIVRATFEIFLFVSETYPWVTNVTGSIPPLRLINAEDVGLEGGVTGNLDSQDPLVRFKKIEPEIRIEI